MKRMKIRSRRAFTLLEILVCLSIIILVSSVISIKLLDLLREYRFTSSVSLLYEDLIQSRIFTTSYQCDACLKIYKKKSNYFYQIVPDVYHPKGNLFLIKQLAGVDLVKICGKDSSSISIPLPSGNIPQDSWLLELSNESVSESKSRLWISFSDGAVGLSTKQVSIYQPPSCPLSDFDLTAEK